MNLCTFIFSFQFVYAPLMVKFRGGSCLFFIFIQLSWQFVSSLHFPEFIANLYDFTHLIPTFSYND